MKRSILVCLFAAAVLPGISPGAATAQSVHFPAELPGLAGDATVTGIASLRDELTRLAEITGTLPPSARVVRRASSAFGAPSADAPDGLPVFFRTGSAEVALMPVRLDAGLLTGYPDDRNNGLLWAGRGASAMVRAGVAARWSVLSVGVAPELAFQQNKSFWTRPAPSAGLSQWIYPFSTGIDYPQRFGDNGYATAGLGQSWIRVDVSGLAAGLSTENLWWGPAQRYPLLMSNTAPGFSHVFAGTGRPLDIWLGDLEGELVWGRLSESDYFDSRPENDHPVLAALVLAFTPRGLPGLSIGGVRVYQYRATEGEWLRDPAPMGELFLGSGVNRSGNELFSVFGRWVFPASGAEVYAEWGRDDRWNDLAEVYQEPDHSQAYMVGFQKVTGVAPGTAVRVHGELVSLQEKGELTRTGSRPLPVWYTHVAVRQGYTNRGQLLAGGGIGVGADAQFLGVDVLRPMGMLGVFVERVRRNDASHAAVEARRTSPYEHDSEVTGGVRALYHPTAALSVSGRVSWAYRYNREFLEDDRNFGITLELSWLPRSKDGP